MYFLDCRSLAQSFEFVPQLPRHSDLSLPELRKFQPLPSSAVLINLMAVEIEALA
jgi:hypothetical protein